MNRGVWHATVCGVAKELEVTEHRCTQEEARWERWRGQGMGKGQGASLLRDHSPQISVHSFTSSRIASLFCLWDTFLAYYSFSSCFSLLCWPSPPLLLRLWRLEAPVLSLKPLLHKYSLPRMSSPAPLECKRHSLMYHHHHIFMPETVPWHSICTQQCWVNE